MACYLVYMNDCYGQPSVSSSKNSELWADKNVYCEIIWSQYKTSMRGMIVNTNMDVLFKVIIVVRNCLHGFNFKQLQFSFYLCICIENEVTRLIVRWMWENYLRTVKTVKDKCAVDWHTSSPQIIWKRGCGPEAGAVSAPSVTAPAPHHLQLAPSRWWQHRSSDVGPLQRDEAWHLQVISEVHSYSPRQRLLYRQVRQIFASQQLRR